MSNPAPAKKWNPWPYAIIAWFVFFISVCIIFVVRTLNIPNDLVADNYYEQGLHHDEKLVALGRTSALENPPRIELREVDHQLVVYIPSFAKDAVLTLYRPSDARLDRRYALQDGQPSVLSSLDLHPGLWEASINWSTDGVAYFHKQTLSIP
jgi:hypothetical protein